MRLFLTLTLLLALTPTIAPAGDKELPRWSADKANAWYAKQPWLVGCNFIPSTAINQLEMWQADTFDEATIDRELGWAEGLGMNCVRVYLHDIAWETDAEGFKKRVSKFLDLAAKHKIRPIFVLFDACWQPEPKAGKQPAPVPGVHNSGWVQSPAHKTVTEPKEWGRLEKYVKDVVGSFRKDQRILMWDVYNEPGNSDLHEKSLPLLKAAFRWSREAGPTQPLTCGTWYGNKTLNEYQLQASDVITFHNYNDLKSLKKEIADLKKLGRPVICTEWMARSRGSNIETHLQVFKDEQVGCLNWGLVSGKTNTIYPWGSPKGAAEPKVWFHDIFRPDGTPFDAKEVELIRKLTGKGEAPKGARADYALPYTAFAAATPAPGVTFAP
jgi:hypothetical protein